MSRRVQNGGPSAADKIAYREEVCDKILALLEQQPRTVAEIMAELQLTDSTTCRYLNYLAEMGEASRSAERGPGNRNVWQLGQEGVAKATRIPTGAFSGAKVVPARQLGMQRHPQDVAFFGPAKGVAA